jgi:hypothetical protein
MRARLVVAVVVLSALAFAPAPFPRTKREDQAEINLDRFQGLWKAESFETVIENGRKRYGGWEHTQVRVEGDRWTYLEGGKLNAEYRVRVKGRGPATIDFYQLNDKTEWYMTGLIRRRDGKVEILFFNVNARRGTQATSFDNPPVGWWVLTLRRDG